MPRGPKGEKRPSNAIESGIMVARIATGDIDEEYAEVPESVPNRSKGGKKGGKARSEALPRSAARRSPAKGLLPVGASRLAR